MATNKPSNHSSTSVGETLQPSSQAEIDRALDVLTAHKDAWAAMDIPGRIALLDQIKQDMAGVEARTIAAGLEAKENQPDTFDEFVEWYSISVIYRYIRILRKALQDTLQFGKPKIPGKVSVRPNGQVVAQVVPCDWKEAMALPGIRAEVWIDPSVSMQNGGIPQASFYHTQNKAGQICVVLGAGNVGGLVPGDFMHKLFVEGQVVALKMNPVNEYLGPFMEEGFNALIKAGFLQILYGDAQEGSYLCYHPAVDSVHMTCSYRTFEAVVFGPAKARWRLASHPPSAYHPGVLAGRCVSPPLRLPSPTWLACLCFGHAPR